MFLPKAAHTVITATPCPSYHAGGITVFAIKVNGIQAGQFKAFREQLGAEGIQQRDQAGEGQTLGLIKRPRAAAQPEPGPAQPYARRRSLCCVPKPAQKGICKPDSNPLMLWYWGIPSTAEPGTCFSAQFPLSSVALAQARTCSWAALLRSTTSPSVCLTAQTCHRQTFNSETYRF